MMLGGCIDGAIDLSGFAGGRELFRPTGLLSEGRELGFRILRRGRRWLWRFWMQELREVGKSV